VIREFGHRGGKNVPEGNPAAKSGWHCAVENTGQTFPLF
jgi:hypothetical protein